MKRVDQLVDGGSAVLFRNVTQMSITGCCRGIGMAEQGLDVTKGSEPRSRRWVAKLWRRE